MSRWLLPTFVAAFLLAGKSIATGWDAAVAIPGATARSGVLGTELRFDAAGHGTITWTDAFDFARDASTPDGAASWSEAADVPDFASGAVFAIDAQGNRVWAWTANFGDLRVQRTGASELPSESFSTIPTSGVSVISLATTPTGDALIAFRGLNDPAPAGVAIWKAGEPAPTTAQTFATSASFRAAVAGALDPSGSAVLVFSDGAKIVQSVTASAGSEAFGAPAELGAGQSSVRAAQAADGRALFAWSEAVVGSPSMNRTWIAGRASGAAVGAPQIVFGGGGLTTSGTPDDIEVAMAPNGRVVVGDFQHVNHTTSGTCADFLGDTTTVAASGAVDASGVATLMTTTLNTAGTDGFRPFAGAGPDGRLAVVWGQWDDCGPTNSGSNRKASYHAAFAGPTGALASIGVMPLASIAVGFRGDGRIAIIGPAAIAPVGAPLFSALYDTGVPVPEPDASLLAAFAMAALIAQRRWRSAIATQRAVS